jgi:hypothetical protein
MFYSGSLKVFLGGFINALRMEITSYFEVFDNFLKTFIERFNKTFNNTTSLFCLHKKNTPSTDRTHGNSFPQE